MSRWVPCVGLSTMLLLAASPGIRPRADANSYAAHIDQPDFSLGAVVIPPQQVKQMFKADLNRAGYVVIEVGVFPAPGKDVDLYPNDFTLDAGRKSTALRPVSGDTIAEVIAGTPESPTIRTPGGVNTSAGAAIGRTSYPDPVTGRRTGGTVADTEAGVGVGGQAPQPCAGLDCDASARVPAPAQPSHVQNANVISQDLWEKSLPDGKTPHAVAGYLYFPKPGRKAKNAQWELRYENADSKAKLQLPK